MTHGIYIDDLVAKIGEPWPPGSVLLTHMQHDMTEEARNMMEARGGHVQRHRSVTKREYRQFSDYNILEPNIALVAFSRHIELIKCDCLEVRHRRVNIGDPVKVHPKDAMGGTVISTTSTATLTPLGAYTFKNGATVRGSGLQQWDVPDNVTFSEVSREIDIPVAALERSESINANTILVYKDWVGAVDYMLVSVSIMLSNKTVVELLPEDLEDGTTEEAVYHVGDFVTSTKANVRQGTWIFGHYNPNISPSGTIVRVRNREVAVRWLHRRCGFTTPEPPEILERLELDSPDLCIYSWTPQPVSLAITPRASHFENDISNGMRVKFREPALSQRLAPLHHTPRISTNGFDINVYDVLALKTSARVLWQDGRITDISSLNLCVEESSLHDEHIAWVGEVAHTVASTHVTNLHNVFTPTKVGIVQAVDAAARTAWMQWCPSAAVHYLTMADAPGEKELILHKIGVAAGPIELVSLYDIIAPAELNLSRGDLVMLDAAAQSEIHGLSGITWLGTMIDEYLTGELVIRLSGAIPVQDVVLRREQVVYAIRFDELTKPTVIDNTAFSVTTGDDDMNVDDSDEGEEEGEQATYEVQYDGEAAQEVEKLDLDIDADDWESVIEWDPENEATATDEALHHESDVPMQTDSEMATGHIHGGLPLEEGTSEQVHDVPVTRTSAYTMHEGQAPYDHRYLTSPTSNDNVRARRLQKEHRILQRPGSLPDGVYVHAWDSRLDLLRVLFIGPSDTAYADCPFIIDFYLPESYPLDPPSAFFHSWTVESGLGAVGKVNPNLYEDGKVCLSLLGTWAGEKSESWTHASTFLQVVVSILGLVLVKEPYWNEPGFDTQMGTEEGQRQVMLYNERIVLRALNFAIVAVDALRTEKHLSGTMGLRDQLMSLYIDADNGSLLQQLEHRVSNILIRSETSTEADGLKILSKGACIALGKVHARLKQLLAASGEA